MNIDFALVLTVAVLVTGAIYLLDRFYLAPRRATAVAQYRNSASTAQDSVIAALTRPSWLVENACSVFPVLALVLVLRSFLYEPFQIPSGSMLPTLKVGDFILVNKYDYGLRLPVLGTQIIPVTEPRHGDVMVFKVPETGRNQAFGRGGLFIGQPSAQRLADQFGGWSNQGPDYIKRVIGLPGDTVEYRNKQLWLNGEPVARRKIGRGADVEGSYTVYRETLGEQEYTTQVYDRRQAPEGRWVVPEGHYFLVGDNRDNSLDSRYWGFVPQAYIVGHATYVWMHWPSWTQLPSFSRNGAITPES